MKAKLIILFICFISIISKENDIMTDNLDVEISDNLDDLVEDHFDDLTLEDVLANEDNLLEGDETLKIIDESETENYEYIVGVNEWAKNVTEKQKQAYLTPAAHCKTNAAIVSKSKELVKGCTSVEQKANKICYFVNHQITYQSYSNSKYDAIGTLANKRGNCCDKSNLVNALCRAAGIPSRYVHGKNVMHFDGKRGGHVWAQIMIGDKWIACDATNKSKNSLGKIGNWNTKVKFDFDRLTNLNF